MSFIKFCLFYFICTIILIVILYLIYKFVLKKKFDFISKFTESEIDKYFNAYDNDKEIKKVLDLGELFNSNSSKSDFLKDSRK